MEPRHPPSERRRTARSSRIPWKGSGNPVRPPWWWRAWRTAWLLPDPSVIPWCCARPIPWEGAAAELPIIRWSLRIFWKTDCAFPAWGRCWWSAALRAGRRSSTRSCVTVRGTASPYVTWKIWIRWGFIPGTASWWLPPRRSPTRNIRCCEAPH